MTITVTSRVIRDGEDFRCEMICMYERETFTVQNRINEIVGSNLVEMKTNLENGEVYLEVLDYDKWLECMAKRVTTISLTQCHINLD